MSTLALETKEALRVALEPLGIVVLDCPLSGTAAQAARGDLVVYASGDAEAIESCRQAFDAFSRATYWIGDFGMGSRMKYIANLLVAIHNASAAEAIALADRAGLDPGEALRVLSDGAGTSRMLEVRGPMMVERRYEPATMSVALFRKDLAIISEFIKSLGIRVPLFDKTSELYDEALARGLGSLDTAAIRELVEPPARDDELP
jgi:3-hydroxyisobutyrate dehydrogenase-like beta-hydroxyacid dehydrogenase